MDERNPFAAQLSTIDPGPAPLEQISGLAQERRTHSERMTRFVLGLGFVSLTVFVGALLLLPDPLPITLGSPREMTESGDNAAATDAPGPAVSAAPPAAGEDTASEFVTFRVVRIERTDDSTLGAQTVVDQAGLQQAWRMFGQVTTPPEMADGGLVLVSVDQACTTPDRVISIVRGDPFLQVVFDAECQGDSAPAFPPPSTAEARSLYVLEIPRSAAEQAGGAVVDYAASGKADHGPSVGMSLVVAEGRFPSNATSWSVSAAPSDVGLCLSITTAGLQGATQGCGFGVPEQRPVSHLMETTTAGTVVAGVTTAAIRTVEFTTAGGRAVSVPTSPVPAGLDVSDVRLFSVAFADGDTPVTMVAVDPVAGEIVESLDATTQ